VWLSRGNKSLMTIMRSAVLLLLGSLVSCDAARTLVSCDAVTPSDLANFFSSSNGLGMSSLDARSLAQTAAPKLTKCVITVSMLQALRDALYTSSGMDLALTQVRSLLLPLAYQQVTPVNLVALYKTLYATDGVDLPKSDAVSRASELAKKKVDALTLKSLFSALYATSGMDLPKKAAQMQAMELALSGANPTQLKLAYQAFRDQGEKPADALQAAIPVAIAASFQGLARRHAADAGPHTAVQFQKYFGSQWVSTWESAPQEERVAKDQKAYTIAEFIQYYKDSSYWTQAKTATQKRLADDGQEYTMEEFKQYYTSPWQQKWMVADVLPCAECKNFCV